jgi:muramoyltetrapeptide carboxypeptidase LdcA involved in peptidoglycan recycling
MKIALVNLSKIEDFSETKYFASCLDFLKENNVDFVDYVSGRKTIEELLEGFHNALKNEEVELVWFVQGGNKLVRFLDKIDWNLVSKTNKEYLGTSDFTHFVFKAVELGKTCYYGPVLKNIKDYFPNHEEQKFIVDFINNKKLNIYSSELIQGKADYDLENSKIIGGHSFISAIMLPTTKIDLKNRFLFFEHHYISGESFDDLEYFMNAVNLYLLNNKPRGIILGHSFLFDENKNPVNIRIINKQLAENIKDFDVPIYYIDHLKTIIKFS